MVAKPKEPSEADILANQLMVRKAEKLRLVASWFPARTPEELASVKTQEELEQEEKEMFAPVPETLGVGAAPPKDDGDGIFKRKDTSSLAALRQQLLGRNAKAPPVKGSKQGPQSAQADWSTSTKAAVDVDSDDEGGRTAAFTSRNQKSKAGKKKAKQIQLPEAEKAVDNEDDSDDENAQLRGHNSKAPALAPSKRKTSSFLDEILEGKKKKKKLKNG